MPPDELIHTAVRLWAAACERRTAQHKLRPSRADFADSSSEGLELSLPSQSSNSDASPSDDSCSSRSSNDLNTSEGSSSHGSVSLPATLNVPIAQQNANVPEVLPNQSCPWFKGLLERKPVLARYASALRKEGFDSQDTFVFITIDDMARMELPPGVRRLLEDEKKKVNDVVASSSAPCHLPDH